MLWAFAAATALLVGAWGVRNKRAGYQRPPRRALLEEGFRLLRPFAQPESPSESAAPTGAKETPIAQLLSLSLAVQSGAPAPAPVEERVEDSEVIHSPT